MYISYMPWADHLKRVLVTSKKEQKLNDLFESAGTSGSSVFRSRVTLVKPTRPHTLLFLPGERMV